MLVDGLVGGKWKILRQRDVTTLEIDPFAVLRKADRVAGGEEGSRLLAFCAPDASVHKADFPARTGR